MLGKKERIRVVCPYCEGDNTRLKGNQRVFETEGGGILIVRDCFCKDCFEFFYAAARYKRDGDYKGYAKDTAESELGVKLRQGGRRWPSVSGNRVRHAGNR